MVFISTLSNFDAYFMSFLHHNRQGHTFWARSKPQPNNFLVQIENNHKSESEITTASTKSIHSIYFGLDLMSWHFPSVHLMPRQTLSMNIITIKRQFGFSHVLLYGKSKPINKVFPLFSLPVLWSMMNDNHSNIPFSARLAITSSLRIPPARILPNEW